MSHSQMECNFWSYVKREEELGKTSSHVWESGRAFCSCTLLAFSSRTECVLPCGFEQPAGGFVFYTKLLLNLSNCRANEAAPKDKLHLLKFILVDSGEIVRMDVVY